MGKLDQDVISNFKERISECNSKIANANAKLDVLNDDNSELLNELKGYKLKNFNEIPDELGKLKRQKDIITKKIDEKMKKIEYGLSSIEV